MQTVRDCGHPLGITRWCPDCALEEMRQPSQAICGICNLPVRFNPPADNIVNLCECVISSHQTHPHLHNKVRYAPLQKE